MITMDVFNNSAFSATTLTTAIRDIKFTPGLVTGMNLATRIPVRTQEFLVERMADTQRLIPITERGSPRTRATRDRRNIRNFRTERTGKTDIIRAPELAGIRAFGSETELEAVQTELMLRMARLRRDHEFTEEFRQLGMIQGRILDADGLTVVKDWFTEFGIAPPTELGFNWASRTNVAEYIRANVIRPIYAALQGRAPTGMRIVALCGSTFFDGVTSNAEVKDTYKNWEAAAQLRSGLATAYGNFQYGEVEWVEYRGSSNSEVAIAADKCRIFPLGVTDMFQKIISPCDDDLSMVGTLGQEFYARQLPDPSGRNEFIEFDMDAYNMHVCTTPEALLSGRAGA